MNDSRVIALQGNPLSAQLESGLAARLEVVRWFELSDAQKATFLRQRAGLVRAVVAGGDIGCSNELMQALPALGIIAINGVGLDRVDRALAHERGVQVTTTPGLLTEDVADLAIGLVISLLRGIPSADAHIRGGHWRQANRPLGRKVSGRRFGIVGLGQIGSAIATRLAAFGPVAYHGPHLKPAPYAYHSTVVALAAASDVVVVACPANTSTYRLIGAQVLDALGADGYLVNISRGSVVDEPALIAALDAGRIAGAALDVFEHEPHVPTALCASQKVVLTPHIASATVETRMKMSELVLANLDAFLNGRPPPTAVPWNVRA